MKRYRSRLKNNASGPTPLSLTNASLAHSRSSPSWAFPWTSSPAGARPRASGLAPRGGDRRRVRRRGRFRRVLRRERRRGGAAARGAATRPVDAHRQNAARRARDARRRTGGGGGGGGEARRDRDGGGRGKATADASVAFALAGDDPSRVSTKGGPGGENAPLRFFFPRRSPAVSVPFTPHFLSSGKNERAAYQLVVRHTNGGRRVKRLRENDPSRALHRKPRGVRPSPRGFMRSATAATAPFLFFFLNHDRGSLEPRSRLSRTTIRSSLTRFFCRHPSPSSGRRRFLRVRRGPPRLLRAVPVCAVARRTRPRRVLSSTLGAVRDASRSHDAFRRRVPPRGGRRARGRFGGEESGARRVGREDGRRFGRRRRRGARRRRRGRVRIRRRGRGRLRRVRVRLRRRRVRPRAPCVPERAGAVRRGDVPPRSRADARPRDGPRGRAARGGARAPTRRRASPRRCSSRARTRGSAGTRSSASRPRTSRSGPRRRSSWTTARRCSSGRGATSTNGSPATRPLRAERFARALRRGRFPVPRVRVVREGSSAARYVLARVTPNRRDAESERTARCPAWGRLAEEERRRAVAEAPPTEEPSFNGWMRELGLKPPPPPPMGGRVRGGGDGVEYRCDSSSGSGWGEERRDESDVVGTKPTRARRPRRRRRVEDIFSPEAERSAILYPSRLPRTVGLTERREIRKGPATLSRFPRFPGTVRPSERTGISTGTRRVTKTRARGRARVMSTAMHATPARAKIAPRVAALGAGAASRACPVASARVSRSRRGIPPSRGRRPVASARPSPRLRARRRAGRARFRRRERLALVLGRRRVHRGRARGVDRRRGLRRPRARDGGPRVRAAAGDVHDGRALPPRGEDRRALAIPHRGGTGDDQPVQQEHPERGVHHEPRAEAGRVHAEHPGGAAGRGQRHRLGLARPRRDQLPRHQRRE